MKSILRYISKQDRLMLILAVLFVIASTWLETLIPAYMGAITGILQMESPSFPDILRQGGMMILLALCSLAAAVGTGLFTARFCGDYLMRLRQAVFHQTLRVSSKEVGEYSTGGLITRCTSDVTQIQKFITGSAMLLIKAPLTTVLVITRVVGVHPYWMISAVLASVVISVLFFVVFIRVVPKAGRMHQVNDSLTNVNREHLSGIRVIHAFNAYAHQEKRIRDKSEEMLDLELFYNRHFSLMSPATSSVMNLLSMMIYVTGAVIIAGVLPAEQPEYYSNMAAFLSYGTQLVSAFIYLVMAAVGFPRVIVAVRRIGQIINREPDIQDGPGVKEEPARKGTLEFRNVSFRYPGTTENALTGISFTAAPGETVAIIGATGSGKTSLLDLIPRMYDVTEGAVLVDGHDVREYRLKDLRNRLGYVPQKGFLFSGTIAENGHFQVDIAKNGETPLMVFAAEGNFKTKEQDGGKTCYE